MDGGADGPGLAETVLAVDRRFTDECRAIVRRMFPPSRGVDPRFLDIGHDFAFVVMDGIACSGSCPE